MSSLLSSLLRLRRHERGRLADERGVALVEFALVLPLLLLVIFAIVDFGRALAFWNDQTHLANEAARYAVVNSCAGQTPCPLPDKLNGVIKSQAESSGATVAICYPSPGGTHNVGDPLHVTVRDTFTWIPLDINFMGIHWTPGPATMKANVEMRLETDQNSNYKVGSWVVDPDDSTKHICTGP
jgi:Flp pilus assembly protein TadG